MKGNHNGFIGITTWIFLLLILGTGIYFIHKNRDFSIRDTLSISLNTGTETLQTTPVLNSQTSNILDTQQTPSKKAPSQLPWDMGDDEVRIVSPVSDQTFKAGDSIKMQIIIGKKITNFFFVISTLDNSGKNIPLTERPADGKYSYTYTIPNTFIGPLEFRAVGIKPIDSSISAIPISTIQTTVKTTSTPVSFYIETNTTPNPNDPFEVGVPVTENAYTSMYFKVKYSDGVTRQIPASYIQYTLSDSSIVTIKKSTEVVEGNSDNALILYGVNFGITNLTIKYLNISSTYHLKTY